MKTAIFVEKLSCDSDSLRNQFSRSFEALSLLEGFNNARAVFIKPNLTYPEYKPGVTTRREFVEGLVAALRQVNSETKIFIGEGEGGYNSFSMTDAMKTMGFYEIQNKYTHVHIVNLSNLERVTVTLKARGKSYPIELPSIFFDEIDFSISCPLPKVHCMTGITLALKNQWGCLPDTMRLKNHFVFNEIISQICEKLKFQFAFLDGKYGLDINGPMAGQPVEVNWFVASNSLGAFDITVAEMMGFDWRTIKHIKMAHQNNSLPKPEHIRIIGDIDSLNRKFTLKRDLWNYPALVAFYSSRLTHLFYFSRWAKLLHDIMYTFRKRPIE